MAETIRTYFLDYDLILFGRLAYDGDAVNVSTQQKKIWNMGNTSTKVLSMK